MRGARIFLRVFVLFVLLLLLLDFIGLGGLLQPIWILFAGWIAFLARVVPQITINWSGIGMVVVCSALVIGGMHWLGQWLYAHWVRQGSPDADVRWRWTWTASLYGGLWLLFLAAMGVTGVVHQVGWLAATKEPLYVERYRFSILYAHLQDAATYLAMAADETDWKTAETRLLFHATEITHVRTPRPLEDLHAIYLEKAPDELDAVILFHRDPNKAEKSGFRLVSRSKASEHFKMNQLPTVLARYPH